MAETVPDFSIDEVESFCFHLHCIFKGKTKQRSKNLFNPQMKILQHFAKNMIWGMADTVLDFSINEVENFYFHLHYIYKGKTKHQFAILLKRLKNLFDPQMKISHHFAKNTHMSHGGKCSRL